MTVIYAKLWHFESVTYHTSGNLIQFEVFGLQSVARKHGSLNYCGLSFCEGLLCLHDIAVHNRILPVA